MEARTAAATVRWPGTKHHCFSLSIRCLQMESYRASPVQPDQQKLGGRASGQLRESLDLKFIRTTKTTTGLKVTARLDTTDYPTGVKVSKRDLAQLSIRQKRVLPKWNYTIS